MKKAHESTCSACMFTFKTELEFSDYPISHISCTNSDKTFAKDTWILVIRHMIEKCNDCCYQAYCSNELRNYLRLTGHQAVLKEQSS